MYKNKPTQLSHDFTLFHPASIRREAVPISSHPLLCEYCPAQKIKAKYKPNPYSAPLCGSPQREAAPPRPRPGSAPTAPHKAPSPPQPRLPAAHPGAGPARLSPRAKFCRGMNQTSAFPWPRGAAAGARPADTSPRPARPGSPGNSPGRQRSRAAARAGPGPAEPLSAPPLPPRAGCSGRAGVHPASPATFPEL